MYVPVENLCIRKIKGVGSLFLIFKKKSKR